jgi:DNA-binding MarR family transcriptional regulator
MYDTVPPNILAKTWVLFDQTSYAVYRASSKRVQSAGVSLEQTRVLFVLSRASSPPTCADISRAVMRKRHTVTALLQGMERADLIARIKDDRNKKLVRVVMTQKGKEAWKRVVQTELATELTASLSSEEYYQLSNILEKLRDTALRELEAESASGGN